MIILTVVCGIVLWIFDLCSLLCLSCFFFKQKTAYEMRISDWSSDVCSSDLYLSPWDLGYGPFVKFDHEFIGRAALEKMTQGPHRRKVTLALDRDRKSVV